MFGKEIRLLTFNFFFPFFWVLPRVESWKLRGRYHAFLQLLIISFLHPSLLSHEILMFFNSSFRHSVYSFGSTLIIFHNVGNNCPTWLPNSGIQRGLLLEINSLSSSFF